MGWVRPGAAKVALSLTLGMRTRPALVVPKQFVLLAPYQEVLVMAIMEWVSVGPSQKAMIIIGINFGAAVDDTFMAFIKKMPTPEPWLTAMIKYPAVEAADMKCPTLWVVGSANDNAFQSAEAYKAKLGGTRVTLAVFDGLNHPQEFEQIDRVFPREVEFTRAAPR